VIYTNVPKVDDERICPVCTDEAPAGKPPNGPIH
jgi:hypothetical protein